MLASPVCQVKNNPYWVASSLGEKKSIDLYSAFLYSIGQILTDKSMSLGDNNPYSIPIAPRV
jgi:hypothetical protein